MGQTNRKHRRAAARPVRKPPPHQRGVVKSPPAKKQKKATHWGDVAEWYDRLVGDEGGEYHREVIFPNLLRLIALGPEEPVVDVACGQGALCRVLHEHGYRPTGVDAAAELIQLARQRSKSDIQYYIGDARELTFLRWNYFAAATCVLAIQNIDPVQPIYEGIQRALAPMGRVVTVMVHPAFRGPKYTSWGWDEERRAQYRRVDRYLIPRKEPIITHPGLKDGSYTWTFHRPIQAYIKAIRNAGLYVDAIEEWTSHRASEAGPRAAAENQARREIPMFMAIRAVKVPPPKLESEEEEKGSPR